MRKSITLIQMMVCVVILGILALLVTSNIKGVKLKAEISAALTDKRTVQGAVDRFVIKSNTLPTVADPKMGEPSEVDWSQLNEDYFTQEVNNKFRYWVDVFGTVWQSQSDKPSNVRLTDNLDGTTDIQWDPATGSKGYNIGKYENGSVSWIGDTQNSVCEYQVITPQPTEVLVVSSFDKYSFQSAPVARPLTGMSNNKPTAVITMTPNAGITTATTLSWAYANSTDPDGHAVVNAEWQGKQDVYATAGTYTVQLRVQDELGMWSDWTSITFTVSAQNTKPTAVISMSPNSNIDTATTITWSSASSFDPDGGTIVSEEWQNKQDVYSTAGNYAVQLRVQDNSGQWSDWITISFAVANVNTKPVAVISMTPSADINTTTPISWSYTSSTDIDGDSISNAEWQLNTNPVTSNPNGIISTAGNYTMWLRVQDNRGLWSDWVSKAFTVIEANNAPTAIITMTPNSSVTTDSVITWNYGNSTDPDGDSITNAEWVNKYATYAAGTYTVQLRVQDSKGLWSSWVSTTFSVTQANRAPTAVITMTPNSSIKTDTTITWNYGNSTDPDGDAITNAEWINKAATYASGSQTVQLRVQDSNGLWSTWTSVTFDVTQAIVLANIKQVAHGDEHALILMKDGTVYTAGMNSYGELGDGTTSVTGRSVYKIVPNLSNVVAIDAGLNFSVALLGDGTIKTWGSNVSGQLGTGTAGNSSVPVLVKDVTTAVAITASYQNAAALLSNGTIVTWGNNDYGQKGIGSTTTTTLPSLPAVTNVKQIFTAYENVYLVKNDGTVWMTGRNQYGQCGDGSTSKNGVITTFYQVPGLTNVTQVSGGYASAIALLSNGTAKAWGYNNSYQLGDGTATTRTVPTPVLNLTNAVKVMSTYNANLALLSDGTLKAWGGNASGQIGSLSGAYTPTTLATPELVKSIETGVQNHSILTVTDHAYLIGRNNNGQLGLNDTVDKWEYTLPVIQ